MVHGSDSAVGRSWLEFCYVRHRGWDLGRSLGASVPSAAEVGSTEPAFQGRSEKQTSHVREMLSPAGPSLRSPSASSAGRAVGRRGAAQVCRARLCHVPPPPPAPAEAPAAAGRGSEELLLPAPTHSQGTKCFLVKGVLKFGAWSCSPGPGGTRAAGRTAPVSARGPEGLRSVLALEW